MVLEVVTVDWATPVCAVKNAAFESRLSAPPCTTVGTSCWVVVPSPSWP